MCKVRSGTEGEHAGLPGRFNECFRGPLRLALQVAQEFPREVGWVRAQEEEDTVVDRVCTKAQYIEGSVRLVKVELRERVDGKRIHLKRSFGGRYILQRLLPLS